MELTIQNLNWLRWWLMELMVEENQMSLMKN